MFGIDFCDVEMKSRYYLNFLEDILTISPLKKLSDSNSI